MFQIIKISHFLLIKVYKILKILSFKFKNVILKMIRVLFVKLISIKLISFWKKFHYMFTKLMNQLILIATFQTFYKPITELRKDWFLHFNLLMSLAFFQICLYNKGFLWFLATILHMIIELIKLVFKQFSFLILIKTIQHLNKDTQIIRAYFLN